MVVVVPTYDEADNIVPTAAASPRRCSPTSTCSSSTTARPTAPAGWPTSSPPRTRPSACCTGTEKQGLGAAYLHGFRVALERGYDVIGEMDADGSHQPEQLGRLLEALPGADLVIGSRWVPGGSIVNWPRRRELLSRGGNFYTRTLLGIDVRDATAGFRLFRRTTLEQIHLEDVASLGYVFQTDLAHRTLRAGLRVREVPIEFVERVRGESKMRRRGGDRVAATDHRVGPGRARPPAACAWPAARGGRRPAEQRRDGRSLSRA